MHAMDFSSMRMHTADTPNGVWAFELRSKELDPTINQHGRALLPPIPSLSPEQRYITYGVTIAPNVFIALMADSVVMLSWLPSCPTSMRLKRHRLYPQATLGAPDFDEVHRSVQGVMGGRRLQRHRLQPVRGQGRGPGPQGTGGSSRARPAARHHRTRRAHRLPPVRRASVCLDGGGRPGCSPRQHRSRRVCAVANTPKASCREVTLEGVSPVS
jgi:hypothetical protein